LLRKLAGWLVLIQCFCPSNLNSGNFSPLFVFPWQAPGGNVMPGRAAAQPGTGQTVRAIIAPASCRHDNCFAHCQIGFRLSDLALYITALRHSVIAFFSFSTFRCRTNTRILPTEVPQRLQVSQVSKEGYALGFT
jgi:hypothetical protein